MSNAFKNPRSTWDERYRSSAGMLFGETPNAWLAMQASRLMPGSCILCPGDGDGRNSLWLAAQGHHVEAFDLSPVAVERACERALERGFSEVKPTGSGAPRYFEHASGGSLKFEVVDAAVWRWPQAAYDAVAAIFIQFASPALRSLIFQGIDRAVRSQGILIIEGYGPRQMNYRTGGPGLLENLYTTDLICQSFPAWELLDSRDVDQELAEGDAHRGLSHLISMVLRKP